MESSAFWSSFQHDPRDATNAKLRASDRDRDVVINLLGDAFAEGRLDRTEFDDRNAQASQIKVLGDIPPLVNDLVSSTPATLSPTAVRAEAERRYRADRKSALTYATPAIVCWVIWAWVLASGDGTPFPWPIFVTLGTAMPALRLWMNPEDHIRYRMQRIEKKQRRELPGA
ncbi:MAG TPA: DUF1707 domain-containing protein [Marmoricola sp.]|nr:DUF1707 domain-containing protein [Marmoricola sp.]